MGTDGIASDALLLLLETVNKQTAQIKRLEAIVAGDASCACDGSLHKSDTKQLQSSLRALEQQHAAACSLNKSLSEQLQQVEQRVQQLEAQSSLLEQQGRQLQQQLGSPHGCAGPAGGGQGQHKPDVCMSIMAAGSLAAEEEAVAARPADSTAVSVGLPGGRSMAARLNKLEHRMDSLTAAAATTEETLASTTAALQNLDSAVGRQLHNIRTDVKQAILVASNNLRTELDTAAQARQQQDAAQHQEQLKGLTSELDALVSNSQRSLLQNLAGEIQRHTAAAIAASDERNAGLKAQLDRLEEEKADIGLVTSYTGQVADVFEQLATTVADSTQASIAQLIAQQQELRTAVTGLSASKADSSNLLQQQQHCQAQLLELQRGLAAAQAAASEAAVAAAVARTALEPMDGLRLQLAEAQGTVVALQATIAGLDAATSSASSEQQQQAQQLQQLASSQQMLQQQLLALTNHVDPAAAAQLAAAAAGDESALTFQPLGPLDPSSCGSLSLNFGTAHTSLNGASVNGACAWDEAWAAGSYLQAGSSSGGRQGHSQAASAAGGAAAAAQHGNASAPGAAGGGACGDRMGAVLRHLPVAVRLLRLEGAIRELQAPGQSTGHLQGMQQQLESVAERLVAGLTQLEGLSNSSMQQLQEQANSLAAAVTALGSSIQERPTHAQVQESAATAAAAAASRAAAEAVQQQLASLTAELAAVKAGLKGAGRELQQLQEWRDQACKQADALQAAEDAVKQAGQQLQQQVSAELVRLQQEVQQLMARHSAEVARETIKQYRADQEAAHGGMEAAAARVSSLESKLKVVVAEIDSMQEQAAVAAQLQDKHTEVVAALEAALSAQGSKSVTVCKQLRRELEEAQQAHSAQVAAMEAAVQTQGAALAGLAASVAELPSKGRLLEYILKSVKATMSELLSQHKKREEGRWEVWLSEFARVMEQRPTAVQLQKLLRAAQQAAEANAQEAAAQRIQCVSAALESGLMQVQQQLQQLACRTHTLELGTGIGVGEGGVCCSDVVGCADNTGNHISSSSPGRGRTATAAAAAPATASVTAANGLQHCTTAAAHTAGAASSVAALLNGVSSSNSSDASSTSSICLQVDPTACGSAAAAVTEGLPLQDEQSSSAPSAAAAVGLQGTSNGSARTSKRSRSVQPSLEQQHGQDEQQQKEQGQELQEDGQQQERAPSVADSITDCSSELQQLLDLQQQVAQCMLDNSCTQPQGHKAKPPTQQRQRQQRTKDHRRSAEVPHTQQQQQQQQRPGSADKAAGGTCVQQQQQQAQMQQQQQQLEQEAAVQQAAVPSAQRTTQSSKALQVKSNNLLSLQQQLAQCLKEHSCALEQQRQHGNRVQSQQQQQQQQGQRVEVKEAGLEQLLKLQVQLQQAARQQSRNDV